MSVEDIIQVQDRYYILAGSALADDRTLVLKHGDAFAVFDRYGDILPLGLGRYGLFYEDTRHLDRLELRFGALRPLFLSSTITADDLALTADLTNPDLVDVDGRALRRDYVHVLRATFLHDGACHCRLRVRSFAPTRVSVSLALRYGADFADIFEVRGIRREKRGEHLPTELRGDRARLRYRGLDGKERVTRLTFSPAPETLSATSAAWTLRLDPGEDRTLEVCVACGPESKPRPARAYDLARRAASEASAERARGWCAVRSPVEPFAAWVDRSAADLRMMVTDTPTGPYPYAGVPWYSTPFGRDAIITAMQALWVNPDLARGVLRYLASTQATESDPERDAEPGKILHEARGGEMAALKEVPFARYYGSVDSTPLFVTLAGMHLAHTGDLDLARELWPHVDAALGWLTDHGDRDGDGLIEYGRRDERGLVNQAWKDSGDSVMHADGALADGPVAICEAQAYAHAAWEAAADIADALGRPSSRYRERAEAARARFEEALWCEELGTYALALDGAKRQCRVRASNAGHALFTGTASPERAARVADALMADDSFTGWGVRTLSSRERAYNPMSYHNGSVWPHDTAICAAGFARYGMRDRSARVLTALYDAARAMDLSRLPELYCGFARRADQGPTLYPVACSPQAWASGAAFMALGACLGVSVDGRSERVTLDNPTLPPWLTRVDLAGLRAGSGTVDLTLRRHRGDVGVVVTRREGRVEVIVRK